MIVNYKKLSLALMPMLKKYRCKVATLLFVFLSLFVIPTFAAAPSVAVIYPEIRAPFNKIFTDMADGVEDQVNGRTVRYLLKKDYSQQELDKWLSDNNIKVCVALGVRGENATSDISRNIPVILGGVLTPNTTSKHRTAISLAPSPSRLLGKLKQLNPNVKNVIVVYNPSKTEWLIREAQSVAAQHNIELVVYQTNSLSESARIYKKIFKRSDIKNSAIWLPPDPTSVDNRAILSYILEQSWKKNTVVFSSRLAHVNKGVLFAMYPDNLKLGRTLGRAALEELNGNSLTAKYVVSLEDLQTAFNKRTAEHLGIKFTSSDLRNYDAVFPSE